MGRAGREREQVIEQEFVYGEEMATEPIEAGILQASGETVTLWTASRAQSLAWKLLWLVTDRLPQGKDSYDAVLLAEGTPPFSAAVLERTFTLAKRSLPTGSWREAVAGLEINWQNFQLEYGWVEGDGASWKGRLSEALERVVAP